MDSLYPENLDNDFDITKDLESRINNLERRGFIFINPKEDFYNPNNKFPYVLTPSGSKLTLSKINRVLRKIIIGDRNQIEAIMAWESYMLNDIYNNGF